MSAAAPGAGGRIAEVAINQIIARLIDLRDDSVRFAVAGLAAAAAATIDGTDNPRSYAATLRSRLADLADYLSQQRRGKDSDRRDRCKIGRPRTRRFALENLANRTPPYRHQMTAGKWRPDVPHPTLLRVRKHTGHSPTRLAAGALRAHSGRAKLTSADSPETVARPQARK